MDDFSALEELIRVSVHGLQTADYSTAQRDGALGTVFAVDTQLISDETYFVLESEDTIVASGGWSKRGSLFGGDHNPGRNPDLLDPDRDPARIRAFFVRPGWERRGLGSQLLEACTEAARSAGFRRLELVATLPGERLYARHGFVAGESYTVPLANGQQLPVIRMGRAID
jgi:GNAT superfamily N-acetyltransferase